MIEYRVREFDGVFTIQCKASYTIGLLWWTKEIIEWHPVRSNGFPLLPLNGRIRSSNRPEPDDLSFQTLNAAKDKIKVFKKGVQYHEV